MSKTLIENFQVAMAGLAGANDEMISSMNPDESKQNAATRLATQELKANQGMGVPVDSEYNYYGNEDGAEPEEVDNVFDGNTDFTDEANDEEEMLPSIKQLGESDQEYVAFLIEELVNIIHS